MFRFRIPKEEIKDVPEAYLVAVNSFRTLLAGLKGFRHHFKASQPMKLLLAFRHCKLNRHYYDILQPLEVVAVTCGQQGHTTIPSEPVIIVTDDSNLVKDAMNCDNVIGIAYADYDLRKDLIGSKVHFIRKPIRDVGLLQFLQGFYIKDDEPLPQPLSLQPQGIIPIADTYPLVILIAEDDPMSQKLLVRILDKLGYHNVAQANNGEEAVNAAITTLAPRPQLVLMDMEMPVMDGCYASKRIRLELEHGPHIVAMTANAFTEDRNTCLEAGMCDYASKPVKMEALVELLKHAHDVSQRKIPCRCNQWGRVG